MSVIMPEPTKPSSISFEEAALPQGAVLVDDTDPDHQPFIDYLRSRGFSATDYAFMVTPYERGRNSKRIIIPYTYKQQIVGNTSRFCDNNQPKYINDQPSGYVFGLDIQRAEWQYCILAEGVFDALSVHGCAYLHNTISREQARTLSTLNRRIIVVPDQDQAGLAVTDRALELGYQVSIPKWGRGCKDINDAVLRYGRLSTVMSIIEAATNSPIKIKMRKQQLT